MIFCDHVAVCHLVVFVIPLHAARRAMAAEPLPKQRRRNFTGISLSRPRLDEMVLWPQAGEEEAWSGDRGGEGVLHPN